MYFTGSLAGEFNTRAAYLESQTVTFPWPDLEAKNLEEIAGAVVVFDGADYQIVGRKVHYYRGEKIAVEATLRLTSA